VSVCLSATISLELLDRSSHVAVAQSSSGSVALRYVSIMDDVTFGHNGAYGNKRHCNTGVESDVFECSFVVAMIRQQSTKSSPDDCRS